MTSLELEEAVPLGYALISRVARDAGVRVLAIKGPTLAVQGLRRTRPSVDVDVLVDPREFERFTQTLVDLGWVHRVPQTSAQILPLHSVALAHTSWPCEFDIHDRFPGFFADRQEVFDILWDRRVETTLAAVSMWSPDRVAHAAVMALHLLRTPETKPGELEELREALGAFTSAQRQDLKELALATGCAAVLGPILAELHVPTDAAAIPPEWRLYVQAEGVKGVPALYEILRARPRTWPRLIWRSLILTEAEIREKQPEARSGRFGLLLARLRRILWGLRDLPRALWLVVGSLRRNREGG